MSAENVEIVRRMHEQFEGSDSEAWREVISPEVEWDLTSSDLLEARVFHGHEGVEEFFRGWLGAWDDYEQETLELIDAGDSVVAVFRQRGRGKHSGIETERDYFGVYELRDGLVVRYRHFESRDQALAAAGLSPDEA